MISIAEYACCKFCKSKVVSEDNLLAECSKCSALMKLSCCSQTKSAKFVVSEDSSGRETTLSAFEPVLSRIVDGWVDTVYPLSCWWLLGNCSASTTGVSCSLFRTITKWSVKWRETLELYCWVLYTAIFTGVFLHYLYLYSCVNNLSLLCFVDWFG